MNQNKPSGAPTVFSVISFVISVLAFICAVILLLTSAFDPDGGTATAVSNRGILTLTGMIFFTAGVWIFGIIGSLLGFIISNKIIIINQEIEPQVWPGQKRGTQIPEFKIFKF